MLEGKRHDAGMLGMSGLLQQLEQFSHSPTGEPLCLYGDPAYPLRAHLQAPYQHVGLTNDQKAFNATMSSVRVSVEWIFGEIVGYFAFLDYKQNLKIGLSSVGKMYSVCAILRNALTCLHGNSTSNFFNIPPPTLEQYFQTIQ